MTLTEKLKTQLAMVSLSTARDRLRQYRQDEPWTPRRPARSPNPFLQDIPMRRLPWDIDTPGYFEVDLVYHCGTFAHGEYVHTLQMIDVFSGWSEWITLLGRSFGWSKLVSSGSSNACLFPFVGFTRIMAVSSLTTIC